MPQECNWLSVRLRTRRAPRGVELRRWLNTRTVTGFREMDCGVMRPIWRPRSAIFQAAAAYAATAHAVTDWTVPVTIRDDPSGR